MLAAPILHAHCPFSQSNLWSFSFTHIQYKLEAFQLALATFQTLGIDISGGGLCLPNVDRTHIVHF